MGLGKVSIVVPPELPKELDDPEIKKAFKALDDADSACSKKISSMLEEVKKVKKKINELMTLLQNAKREGKDPKKSKAIEAYLSTFGSYKDNFFT